MINSTNEKKKPLRIALYGLILMFLLIIPVKAKAGDIWEDFEEYEVGAELSDITNQYGYYWKDAGSSPITVTATTTPHGENDKVGKAEPDFWGELVGENTKQFYTELYIKNISGSDEQLSFMNENGDYVLSFKLVPDDGGSLKLHTDYGEYANVGCNNLENNWTQIAIKGNEDESLHQFSVACAEIGEELTYSDWEKSDDENGTNIGQWRLYDNDDIDYYLINNIQTSLDKSIDPTEAGTSTEEYLTNKEEIDWNTSHINFVEKTYNEWEEVSTSSWKVDFGINIEGQIKDEENWDKLKLEWRDSDNNIVATSTEDISMEDTATFRESLTTDFNKFWKEYGWDMTGTNIFEYFNIEKNYTDWDPDTYTLKTEMYNSSEDKSTSTQTWTLKFNEKEPEVIEEDYKEGQESKNAIKRAIEDLGIKSWITNWTSQINKKFPFSWISSLKKIWKEEMNKEREKEEPPQLTMEIPEDQEYMAGTEFKLVDFKKAEETYSDTFTTLRKIMAYILWLGLITSIILKSKKLLNSIQT